MRQVLVTAATSLLLLAGCAPPPVAGPAEGPATASASATSYSTPRPVPDATRAAVIPVTRATLAPSRSAPAPVRLRAPSIDVDLPVVGVGVDEDGQMQLPGTVREVGWYSFGASPGDREGTTVLAAHVDTRADGLGPFVRLRDLRRGDSLDVTDERGRDHRFLVTAIDDVEKSDLAPDELFRRSGEPQLKVLTCGGPFDERTGYRDNVVVSARPR